MDFKHDPTTDLAPLDELDRGDAAREAEALREGIAYHDHRYYVKNDPAISDARYDRLFERLQALEERFPDLRRDDSPTQRVGAEPVSELQRRSHTAPMLSLNAVYGRDDVRHFLDTVSDELAGSSPGFVLEPKLDGLSLELVFERGQFTRAVTRGNGEVGEDVTHTVRTVRTVPLRLQAPAPERLAVRGELVMAREGFNDLNGRRVERGDEPFANPRNAAAGMVRQLNPGKVDAEALVLFVYDVMAGGDDCPDDHWALLQRLRKWGFRTHDDNRKGSGLESICDYWESLGQRREQLDFEIDGVVIKLRQRPLRRDLGTRARSPRWALAWKFPPTRKETRVERIVVQVGRTGMLTPVALLRPVEVGGVTVSRATLHNEQEVRRKDIREGDRVRVERAGDVIPEVVSRLKRPGVKRGPAFRMPNRCPVCCTEVEREGAYCFCPAGLSCEAQLVGRVLHFASRNAMDIEHLGEETAAQLVEHGLVRDLADLYALEVDDLAGLEGFAERSARQLHDAIVSSREPRLDRLILGLGIRHVGRRMARVLAQRFESLESLQQASPDALRQVPDIGEETAQAIIGFFNDRENRRVLAKLKKHGVRPGAAPREGQALAGRTFVFTGALDGFTRDEARAAVEAAGGEVSSSVSGRTDYVVVGENPGSKLEQAREHGTERLDEEEFRRLVSP